MRGRRELYGTNWDSMKNLSIICFGDDLQCNDQNEVSLRDNIPEELEKSEGARFQNVGRRTGHVSAMTMFANDMTCLLSV